MNNLILSAPLTHSDWYLKTDGPAWGEAGIRTMLTRCKEFGLSRIYWRVFDAGKAVYASKLVEPFSADDHEEIWQYSPGFIDLPPEATMKRFMQLDYTNLDTLRLAIDIGHELGLEIYAWMSINEDDHGLGFTTKFTREHPQYRWVRRDGRSYHSQLSYAYPEVRKYKLELIREMLAYDIDGLFLDWIRTGDIRDNPQSDGDGVADFGYERPNIEAFKNKYGIDPHSVPNNDIRWIRCRAQPITEFMRDAHTLVKSHLKKLPLLVIVQHPWSYRGVLPEMISDDTPNWVRNIKGNRVDGALNGLLCDIKTWAEENLMDGITAAGYYTAGGNASLACSYIKKETEGKTPLLVYGWVPTTPEDFRRDVQIAHEAGTHEILYWEADYIDNQDPQSREAVITAIRELKSC